ncbi:carbohydrate-binding protein [Polaribacter sp. 20A6]|uniref:carbohydrate-binding protein n=1 Tax=Polaribacter sp. 20A6 TaxID=2687289 RepID=UPI0013FE338C|nr:carbohydrate-binding protein [Polaribacter sp. 20A6]
MILKNMHIFKLRYLLLFLVITILSCEVEELREVTLFEKGITNASASATDIESGGTITFTDLSTKVYSREWTFPGGSLTTSTEPVVDVTFNNTSFDEILKSDVVLTIKHIDNSISEKIFNVQIAPINALPLPIPFGGIAVNVPGTIEAENYDEGGQGVAYNDTEEENLAETAGSATYRDDDGVDVQVSTNGLLTSVGYTAADEWINYTVEVTETGVYDIEFVVASGSTTGGKSIKFQKIAPRTGVITELGETGDFANTGGWDSYTNVTIPAVTLIAGTNTFRTHFTGADTNLDKINIKPTQTNVTYRIAFATDDSAGVDAGYITMLKDAGYEVDAVDGAWNNLDVAGVNALNGYDLVIISRNTNSGNFGGDPTVKDNWMTVKTPLLLTSCFITRNSRLQFVDSGTFVENASPSFNVDNTSHPIFTGVTLTGSGETGDIISGGNTNITDVTTAGNGSLIASDPTTGFLAIGEWEANIEAYTGASTPLAKRMFLGVNAGPFALTDVGQQLYLNSVQYLTSGIVTDNAGGGGSATTLNIAFASDKVGDAEDDLEYIALLESKGHTVNAVNNSWDNLDATGAATLNGYDLVLISRNTNSGNFGSDETVRANWMSVTTPVIVLSSYIARNSRLQLFDSGGFDEGGSLNVTSVDPNHPLFIGINITDGVTDDLVTLPLHVTDVTTAGNGTIYATDSASGNVAIAEWEANTAAYAGGGVAAGRRMFFAVNVGGYALTSTGETLLLNAVNHMAK